VTQIKLARGGGYSFSALVGPGFMGLVRYVFLVLFLFSRRSAPRYVGYQSQLAPALAPLFVRGFAIRPFLSGLRMLPGAQTPFTDGQKVVPASAAIPDVQPSSSLLPASVFKD
jgi:hypothetical protein